MEMNGNDGFDMLWPLKLLSVIRPADAPFNSTTDIS